MTGALLFLQSLSPARLTRRSCLSVARAVLCWKPLLCWKDYRVVSRSFRGKGWEGWVGSAQELFRQGVPVDSLSAASPLPIPRSRRDTLCSRPEPPPGKSAVGVPPTPPHPLPPHNYTLPSLPLLPLGCHRNQPARSRPASRRWPSSLLFPAPQSQPPARDWSCSGR